MSELRGCLNCRITPKGMESDGAIVAPSGIVHYVPGGVAIGRKTLCGQTIRHYWLSLRRALEHAELTAEARPP